MRSTFRRIGFASLAICAVALSAPAWAQDKAPIDADQTELRSIFDNDLKPLEQGAQAAIDTAASDPAQACEVAKATLPLANDARQRFETLYTRMTREGVSLSWLAGMKTNLEAAPDKMTQLATSICSGQFAKMQDDPAMKDMAPIGLRMKAYTDDVIAADAASDNGDTTTACQRAGDARLQLGALSDSVTGLRKREDLSADEAHALNELDTRLSGFRAANDARLKACPAG